MIISAGVENLTSWERKLLYMCNARPTINTRALFSDATNDYRCPAEDVYKRQDQNSVAVIKERQTEEWRDIDEI